MNEPRRDVIINSVKIDAAFLFAIDNTIDAVDYLIESMNEVVLNIRNYVIIAHF